MWEVMPRPPWLPASQSSLKREKTCPDSRPTRVQNFTSLAFSATEKSVTVQTKKNKKKNKKTNKKNHSKLSTPPYGGGNKLLCYFPTAGVKSIVMIMSVCLSVCSHISKTTRANLQIFCTCYLRPWLSPPLMIVQYAMYFRFCGLRHVCP